MVTKNTEKCTGCGMCAVSCPKKCLLLTLNDDGFYVPVLNENNCINCDLCERVCPKNITIISDTAHSSLSVFSKDNNTLLTTSSGGLCYELAKSAIASGKKVCACTYDYESHKAVHTVVTGFDGLDATKGSKYFQSYTVDAFTQLFDGDEWMVFGTPCQIAAIDAATRAKNIRDKFILVDFFCHGTPSMNLWKKYISENNKKKIKKIEFRSKEFGWHSFSLRFTFEDSTTKSDYNGNMFYNFFFNNLILCDACYDCHFKATKSKADIRVGDYWGTKYINNKTGISACLIFTESGKNTIDSIKDQCCVQQEDVNDILVAQMHKSPEMFKERKVLLKAIKGKRSLKNIFSTTLFPYRLKCKIKSLLRRN